jgi:signal transduction histidine kinase
MVNLLADTKPTEEQQKYLNAIKNSSENLKVIINDILDLSALESGKLKFEKIGFRISDIIPQVIEMFLPQAKEKGIELSYDFVPGSEVVLLGDSVRLSQILINLINNAIKFTHEGTISVNAKISKKINQTAYVQVDVKDTGIGIPDEKLEFIFDTFTQADESVTRKYGGTGLGLSIVKQLIDLQNGTIYVKSKENSGSTFSFTIPYEVGTETDLMIESRSETNDKTIRTLHGMRVLLVEDNDINRMYAANIVKNW